jgi:hypothetical protein
VGSVRGQGADLRAGSPEPLQYSGEIFNHLSPLAGELNLNELGKVEAEDDDLRVAEWIAAWLSGTPDQQLVVVLR